jgi:hypothetical protein
MALHPNCCYCEACQDDTFCDMVAEDRLAIFNRTIPRHIPGPDSFASEVDPSSFGSRFGKSRNVRSFKGVTIESLTHFPTPTDPSILSMTLPKFDDDSGIAVTQAANSQAQAVADTSVKIPTGLTAQQKKMLLYGAIAYLLLR